MHNFKRQILLVIISLYLIPLHLQALANQNSSDFNKIAFSDSFLSDQGRFLIYFQREGNNAVPQQDEDSDGIPDWIEKIGDAFERSYFVEVEQLNFQPPPNMAHNRPYPIFVQNLTSYFAKTVPTNLDSTAPKNTNLSSHILFDNDFIGDSYHIHGDSAIKIIAAHEFFHAIQLGYVFRQIDDFFLELSAVWMESQVFPEIHNYRYFFDYYFSSPDIPLSGVSYTIPNVMKHIYGRSIWAFYIAQRFGQNAIREILEEMVYLPALEAMDSYFRRRASSFATEFLTFAAWNFFTGERRLENFGYADAESLPMTPVTTDTVFEYLAERNCSGYFLTAQYHLFHSLREGIIEFSFSAEKVSHWRANVIVFDKNILHQQIIPANSKIELPNFSEGVSILIIAGNVNTSPDPNTIYFKQEKEKCQFSLTMKMNDNSRDDFRISFAAPNPFESSIKFFFSKKTQKPIQLEIFNLLGQKIFSQAIESGVESWQWHQSSKNTRTRPGIYFFRFSRKRFTQTIKAIKIR